MLNKNNIFVAVVWFAATICVSSAKFRVIREWNFVNFTWQNAELYRDAFDNKRYQPENVIVASIKYFENNYYITLPRMKEGVPATLGMIPAGPTRDTAPPISPFPSWEMNREGDCDALQNVQNIEIDPKNGRMWMIDTGRTETLTKSPGTKCDPKLVVYDLRKMEVVLSYTFPTNLASSNGSYLYDIVLDNTEGGYAYISDNGGNDPGILVFSQKENKAWKIRHSESMRADPKATTFNVNDVTMAVTINIASLALGPKLKTNVEGQVILEDDRELYYAPMSSLHLYGINTSVLRNEEFGNGEFQGNVQDYGSKSSQSVGTVMDDKGVLYFSLLGVNSIARWDSATDFQSGQRVIARDAKYLEWVNSICFDDVGNLTLLVNRLNRFVYDKINFTEPNFRIITAPVGGKSYLHHETYSYENTNSTTTSASATSSETPGERRSDVEEPKKESDLEPKPAPEPSPSTSTTAWSPTTEKNQVSGVADRKAMAIFTLLTAGMMFVI